MRTNYVLIDYENLQPELLDALDLEHFRVIVFIGANQPKVTVDFASKLQRLGKRANYIRISGSGRNALDFHIAMYIGELMTKDAEAFFHIISGDAGFAPLIQHLNDRKVYGRQHKAIGEIPHLKAAGAKTLAARVAFARDALCERKVGRPVTVKTLANTIAGMFPGGLDDDTRAGIVEGLRASGFLTIGGTKVHYLDAEIPGVPASA